MKNKTTLVLRMPDASDVGAGASAMMGSATAQDDIQVLQHLASVDLTTIDRSRTILKEGQYPFVIQSIELKKTSPTVKNPKDGHRFEIKLGLLSPTKDEDGKDIDIEKWSYYCGISLNPTEKYNPLERLADVQLACWGVQRKGFNIPDYLGQKVVLKVKVEDSVEFGRQNRERWVPKKAAGATGVASGAAAPGTL